MRVYGASDYAVTADGGDYTVHIVIGVDPEPTFLAFEGFAYLLYSAAPSSARGLKAAANARSGVGPGRNKDRTFQNGSRTRRRAGSKPA